MNWSYSSLKQYETCPRQYHAVRILRSVPREETEQTLYGTALHEAAEEYVKNQTPLPPQFAFMQPIIDALLGKTGQKLAEHEMALTVHLEPCGWKDPAVWVRGIADLLIVEEERGKAWIVDYKTGSAKYPDKDQLDLLSLLVFAHFPKIVQVNSALAFVVKGAFVKHRRYITERDELWNQYRERVAKILNSQTVDAWPPRQSGLCRKYCAVTSCEHNGRG